MGFFDSRDNLKNDDIINDNTNDSKTFDNIYVSDGLSLNNRYIKIVFDHRTIITKLDRVDYFMMKDNQYWIIINQEEILINQKFYQWYIDEISQQFK